MAKKKDKETHIRKFIDNAANADSYIHLTVFSYGNATLKVADCTRSVELHFGSPGDKRSIKKVKALKDVVDALYEYLNKESE